MMQFSPSLGKSWAPGYIMAFANVFHWEKIEDVMRDNADSFSLIYSNLKLKKKFYLGGEVLKK